MNFHILQRKLTSRVSGFGFVAKATVMAGRYHWYLVDVQGQCWWEDRNYAVRSD